MDDAFLRKLFNAIDSQDVDAFLACLHDNATFRFGSAPAVSGRLAVREAVGAFFDSIAALAHTVTRHVTDDTTMACHGEVTYTRHDGRSVTLPFANFFEFDDGVIADYRIYLDIAPLYAD